MQEKLENLFFHSIQNIKLFFLWRVQDFNCDFRKVLVPLCQINFLHPWLCFAIWKYFFMLRPAELIFGGKKLFHFCKSMNMSVCAKEIGNCQSNFVLIDPNDFEPNWQKINGNKTKGWRHHLHFLFQIRSCKAFGPWAFCEICRTNQLYEIYYLRLSLQFKTSKAFCVQLWRHLWKSSLSKT